jgi:hypothetical protein
MEPMDQRAPKTSSFWNENDPEALHSNGLKPFKQLVRMRSAVRIRPAAPKITRNLRISGDFSLLSATFGGI